VRVDAAVHHLDAACQERLTAEQDRAAAISDRHAASADRNHARNARQQRARSGGAVEDQGEWLGRKVASVGDGDVANPIPVGIGAFQGRPTVGADDRADGRNDAELFEHFAAQCGLRRFSRFNPPAHEAPPLRVPLSHDKEPVVVFEDRGYGRQQQVRTPDP
jgi:hypothetical protein